MPTFTENWFRGGSRKVLARLVQQVADVPGRIVEVGSWEGRSTIAIANAAPDRQVHAVDTWRGSTSDVSAAIAKERDVHATWRANIDEATEGNVVECWMDWRAYATSTRGEPIALLFIDAEHTYDEVSAQIDAFLPLIQPGGIICGDDWLIPDVMRAAVERLPNVQTEHAVWWSVPKEA